VRPLLAAPCAGLLLLLLLLSLLLPLLLLLAHSPSASHWRALSFLAPVDPLPPLWPPSTTAAASRPLPLARPCTSPVLPAARARARRRSVAASLIRGCTGQHSVAAWVSWALGEAKGNGRPSVLVVLAWSARAGLRTTRQPHALLPPCALYSWIPPSTLWPQNAHARTCRQMLLALELAAHAPRPHPPTPCWLLLSTLVLVLPPPCLRGLGCLCCCRRIRGSVAAAPWYSAARSSQSAGCCCWGCLKQFMRPILI